MNPDATWWMTDAALKELYVDHDDRETRARAIEPLEVLIAHLRRSSSVVPAVATICLPTSPPEQDVQAGSSKNDYL